ncbi:MAG TPA: cytochrome c [Vicinamibacteria bacterium]|nr:cytochrome c [Vicinamibacteria bacterium]
MRPASVLLLGLAAFGCRQDMHDQPRYKPLARSDFYDDRRASRAPVEGTVARGQLRDDEHLYTGKVGRELAATYPFAITAAALERGRDRYTIYCTPCHGRLGMGEGMVVQRGFKRPTSFHIDRLREAPPGYFFDVMTNGFGAMSDYSAQVSVEDRWAIAAYIRALQISQHVSVADLSEKARAELGRAAVPLDPTRPAAGQRH